MTKSSTKVIRWQCVSYKKKFNVPAIHRISLSTRMNIRRESAQRTYLWLHSTTNTSSFQRRCGFDHFIQFQISVSGLWSKFGRTVKNYCFFLNSYVFVFFTAPKIRFYVFLEPIFEFEVVVVIGELSVREVYEEDNCGMQRLDDSKCINCWQNFRCCTIVGILCWYPKSQCTKNLVLASYLAVNEVDIDFVLNITCCALNQDLPGNALRELLLKFYSRMQKLVGALNQRTVQSEVFSFCSILVYFVLNCCILISLALY